MEERSLTEQEFQGWLGDPGTQAVLRALRKEYESIKENWARGLYTGPTVESTALKNAEKLGEINSLSKLIELEYDFYMGMMDEGRESSGTKEADPERLGGGAPGLRSDSAS